MDVTGRQDEWPGDPVAPGDDWAHVGGLEWLATAARSSGSTLVQVARAVVGGAPLPSDRLAQAKAQRREATDREVAVHRRDSELH